MADTCRRGEGRASSSGDFSPREVGNASSVGATMEAPVLFAIQPRVGSFSAAARTALQQVCSAFADGSATPLGDLGEGRKRHFLCRW